MKCNIAVINNSEVAGLISEIYDSINIEYNVILLKNDTQIDDIMGTHLDILLIDSNNFEVIINIITLFREKKMYRHLPVLLITEIHTYLNTQKIDKLGSVDYLSKPTNKFTLAYRVVYNLNLSNSFRKITGENRIIKSKLVELEKLKIQNLSLAYNQENLEKINSQLAKKSEEIKKQQVILMQEKRRYQELLENILPEETSRELMIHGEAKTQSYQKATILFSDFVGFTKACETQDPETIVSELHSYFSLFDDLCENFFVEKIKTIGDAYMCAGGLPMRNNSNPVDVVLVALNMIDIVEKENQKKLADNKEIWNIRIGIHTGSLIAGVIGKKKFAYDIWGDAVNTAARMETASESGKINISEDTYNYVADFFECTPRGKILAKNKGEIEMYFVEGLKPEFSRNGNNRIPNKDFHIKLAKL